jgi:hypothetical protein
MFTHLLPLLQDVTAIDPMNQFDTAPQQVGPVPLIIAAAIAIFLIAALWKLFAKAGKPGWAAIIPIYNLIVILQISGKPVWWFLLFLIPIVNIVIAILVSIGLAKSFGKGPGFGIGIWLLSFIFIPILAFGDARYQGPAD